MRNKGVTLLRSALHPTVLILLLVPVFAFALSAFQIDTVSDTAEATTSTLLQDKIERGEYLVTGMGCDDCHTPFKMGPNGPEPDMALRLSGHPAALEMPPAPELEGPWMWAGAATNTAFAGPWGISYSANLTPHASGLKGWTEEMFVQSLKTGWHRGVEGSRRIMPPMPWPAFRHLTEEDLGAMFAFLQTIEPIENVVPAYQPPAGPPAEHDGH